VGQHGREATPVSVEAICWALNLAPVPAGRGGQPSTACKFVLVGLADHARAGRLHPCQFIWPSLYRVTECKVTNLAGGHESRRFGAASGDAVVAGG